MTRNARMTDPQANPPDADEVEVPDEVPDELWRPHLNLREQAQIVKIDGNWVWLDIGSKFESKLPLSNWTDEGETPVVGDVVYFWAGDQVAPTDRPMHVARLTVRADPRITLEEVLGSLKVGDVVPGRIIRMFEEGFLVRLEGGGLGHMNALYFGEVPPSTIWNETDATFQSAPWRIVETDDYTRLIRVEPA